MILNSKKTRKYPVVLTRPFSWQLFKTYKSAAFYQDDQLLGMIIGDTLTIEIGYASDGYSPKGITPVPRCGLAPAVIHDFLRQMSEVRDSVVTRKDADDEFEFAMTRLGASNWVAKLYRGVVSSPIGWAYSALRKKPVTVLQIQFS